MKYDWFNVDNENLDHWKLICPPDEYRVYSRCEFQANLPNLLPEGLTNKYDSVVISGSSTSGGTIYYMVNGNRVDARVNAVDQMPFGLAFIGNNTAGSACLMQHGTYSGRTINPPPDFWYYVSASRIESYYPLSEIPVEPAGKLSDLHVDSQNIAFGKLRENLEDYLNH